MYLLKEENVASTPGENRTCSWMRDYQELRREINEWDSAYSPKVDGSSSAVGKGGQPSKNVATP